MYREEYGAPVQALPSCLLVHFTAADLEESRGNTDSSRQIYEDIIQASLPKEPEEGELPDAAKAQSKAEVCSSMAADSAQT